MLSFLVFSGSARQGNYSKHVAKFVADQLESQKDVTAEVISPSSLELDFSNEGREALYPELNYKVKNADGFVLVAPEYNHGYSASLKYMLDLNLPEYIHKPVALVGVSSGPWGGTRVIESLLGPVREMGMVATFTDMNVTNVQSEITAGRFRKPEQWEKRAQKMIDELLWMAHALKSARDKK